MSSTVNVGGSTSQLFVFVDQVHRWHGLLALGQIRHGRCAAGLILSISKHLAAHPLPPLAKLVALADGAGASNESADTATKPLKTSSSR
jgi:hypothetical protein